MASQLYLENAKKHHSTLAKFIMFPIYQQLIQIFKFSWPYVSSAKLAKNHSDLKLRIQIQNCKIHAKKDHCTVAKFIKILSKQNMLAFSFP